MPFILENIVSPHLPVFVFILIISTMPMITLLLGSVSRIEKLQLRQAAAIVLDFIVAVLIAFDMRGGGGHSGGAIWIAMAFGVPLLYAVNTLIIASRWPAGADAIQVGNSQALIISAAVLLGGAANGGIASWPTVTGNLPAILSIIAFEALARLVYLKITKAYGTTYVLHSELRFPCLRRGSWLCRFWRTVGLADGSRRIASRHFSPHREDS
jgi:drug/metabolite transporter (DMT)-like permease